MLIKTKDFVETLNSHLYQISYNKNNPLVQVGSFSKVTYE